MKKFVIELIKFLASMFYIDLSVKSEELVIWGDDGIEMTRDFVAGDHYDDDYVEKLEIRNGIIEMEQRCCEDAAVAVARAIGLAQKCNMKVHLRLENAILAACDLGEQELRWQARRAIALHEIPEFVDVIIRDGDFGSVNYILREYELASWGMIGSQIGPKFSSRYSAEDFQLFANFRMQREAAWQKAAGEVNAVFQA